MSAHRLRLPILRLIDNLEPPEPTQTVRVPSMGITVRRMPITDANRCRLCAQCLFVPGTDGHGICITEEPTSF